MHYAFCARCVLCVFRFVKLVKSCYRTRLWRRDFHESNSPVDYNRIVPRVTTVRGLTLYLSCYLDGIAWRRNRITSEIRAVSQTLCGKASIAVVVSIVFPTTWKDRLTDWRGKRRRLCFSGSQNEVKKSGMDPREFVRYFSSYPNYGNSAGRRAKITSHSLMQHTYST